MKPNDKGWLKDYLEFRKELLEEHCHRRWSKDFTSRTFPLQNYSTDRINVWPICW